MPQITCISFIKYESVKSKIWAFGMMQYAHKHFKNAEGLEFYKLMGSGKGVGFNPLPDWSVYTVLTVWDSVKNAEEFIAHSSLYQSYTLKSKELITIYMHNIKSHGYWSEKKPFTKADIRIRQNQKICIITRATIKKRFLFKFWKYVPTSHKPLHNNPDLIYTKGIGEIPIIQMATFSIWKNLEAVTDFAYKSKEHSEAVQMTRKLGWYREELFARFVIIKYQGKWSDILDYTIE